jgi:hypothetical protein
MSNRLLVVRVLVSGVAIASAYAQSRPTQYVLSADAVKFTPLDPKSPDGVATSVVSGEMQGKGPITLLLRLPKGPAPEVRRRYRVVSSAIRCATMSRSSRFRILPTGLTGNDAITSRRSGSLNDAIC